MKRFRDLVRRELWDYVTENIWSMYDLNDGAHDREHLHDVLVRAYDLNEKLSLNQNIEEIFVAASYHDCCCYIDRKSHHILASHMVKNDPVLRSFFDEFVINRISGAVEDHRASAKTTPASDLGKLISSADRSISIDQIFKRHWKCHFGFDSSSINEMAEHCLEICNTRFGENGYACGKVYFDDGRYSNYLQEIKELIDDVSSFKKKYREVNSPLMLDKVASRNCHLKLI